MRVQRVVSPDDGTESWTVLADDWAPVAPVELFLVYEAKTRRWQQEWPSLVVDPWPIAANGAG